MLFLIQELLLRVAESINVPVEQVQFVFCMLLCFPLGAVYRTVFHPKNVSPKVRLTVSMLWGFAIGWICFGSELLVLILVSTLCYGLTWSVNPKQVHKVVFVASFVCLSVAQIIRMIMHYGINKLDYSGRLMIITAKVTYVACSLHDGLGRKENELTKDQKQQSIKRVPSLLEYFGYLFNHSTLLVGPICTFNDYMDFIEGRDIARATDQKTKKEPSPTRAVVTKLASSLLCIALFVVMSKIFPFHINADLFFIANSSFLWRMAVSFFAMFTARLKFYFAWIIADAGNNACGFGFNGYDPSGRALWNRITNVNPVDIEISTNFRDMLNNWNIQTNIWLRRTVYERVPYHRTYCTLLVSALWHGFYPAYLMTLLASGLLIVATRKVRHACGDLFCSTSPVMNRLFGFLKWFACNAVLSSYVFTPFLLLRFDLSLIYYRSTYFIGHILLIGAMVICPGGKPKPSHDTKGANGVMTSQDSNGSAKVVKHNDISLPSLANNNALHRLNRKSQ